LTEERLDAVGLLTGELSRFVRLARWMAAQLAVGGEDGLEQSAYLLLGRLVCDGGHRATALAAATQSDPSTISRQTAALVRAGLVERRADPGDGRACVLVATDAGVAAFERYRDLRDRCLQRILEDWSVEEIHGLTEGIARLNGDVERSRPRFRELADDQRAGS
jgi:DNA-binding MarR family transcriptional regulator